MEIDKSEATDEWYASTREWLDRQRASRPGDPDAVAYTLATIPKGRWNKLGVTAAERAAAERFRVEEGVGDAGKKAKRAASKARDEAARLERRKARLAQAREVGGIAVSVCLAAVGTDGLDVTDPEAAALKPWREEVAAANTWETPDGLGHLDREVGECGPCGSRWWRSQRKTGDPPPPESLCPWCRLYCPHATPRLHPLEAIHRSAGVAGLARQTVTDHPTQLDHLAYAARQNRGDRAATGALADCLREHGEDAIADLIDRRVQGLPGVHVELDPHRQRWVRIVLGERAVPSATLDAVTPPAPVELEPAAPPPLDEVNTDTPVSLPTDPEEPAPPAPEVGLPTDPEPHPLADQWPLLAGEEYDTFRDDVRANGLRCPILLYDGRILDGRNRLRACRDTDVEPRYETFVGSVADAEALVQSLNDHRRHLTAEFRRERVAKLRGEGLSTRAIAERLDMHPTQVARDLEAAAAEANTAPPQVYTLCTPDAPADAPEPEKVKGRDGKTYQRRRKFPHPAVAVRKSLTAADNALAWYTAVAMQMTEAERHQLADALDGLVDEVGQMAESLRTAVEMIRRGARQPEEAPA